METQDTTGVIVSRPAEGKMKKNQSRAQASDPRPTDRPPAAIVAVHGIGDQVCHATIQQVVAQFSRFYDDTQPAPLGGFDAGPVIRRFRGREFQFSEVYWAGIPREIARDGYRLEETKVWATSIVGRLRWLAKNNPDKNTHVDYPMVQQVIGEMVETIGVLERLTSLAEKAGLGRFNLNEILVDYIDDVQLVAEFASQRGRILECFNDTLSRVDARADIYIVAHSEGTVVAFLGLLHALWADEPPPWLRRVRGLMTIGSPIDKHLVLWPDLFPWATPPRYNPTAPAQGSSDPDRRIRWRNYYDYGDPVGYELDYARVWLHAPERSVTAFEFCGRDELKPGSAHDIGFSRYALPGKAHNDYWGDPDVFDHFIGSVIEESPQAKAPKNRLWPTPVAYAVPYALIFLLIAVGVFFTLRSVHGFIAQSSEAVTKALGLPEAAVIEAGSVTSSFGLVRDAAGIACLLAGMTVLARLPRLVSPKLSRHWMWIALLVFAGLAALFWTLTTDDTILAMNKTLELVLELAGRTGLQVPALRLCAVVFAFLISVGAAWAGRHFLESTHGRLAAGSKPLITLGGASAIIMIITLLGEAGSGQASLWPVVLALAGFLYLWWLAILLFDLIFVWHRYVRHGLGDERLEIAYGNR